MKENHILGASLEGFHKVFYREYGNSTGNNTLFTVHGLTRNSTDFHFLAEALEGNHHVISPDVVGRGHSGRFQDPKHYSYAQYLSDMTALIARSGAEKVDWLGTSMGGLFGIMLAAHPNTPIRRLILNDIGPFVPKEAVDRIRSYASTELIMQNMEEVEATLRTLYAPFGIEGEKQWAHVIPNSIEKKADGTFTLAYDPAATGAVQDEPDQPNKLSNLDDEGNVIFWEFWEKINCPVLVINGAESDILPPKIVDQMKERGPKFDHYLVDGVGHAPALMADDQIAYIKEWLEKTS